MGAVIYPTDAQAKRDIVEAGRRMYQRGFAFANDGNISARVTETQLWATPSGVSKGFMTEDMLIKLDINGNVLERSCEEGGSGYKPSSEIKLHLAVYRESPELISVVHAHPPVAAAFAAAGEPLDKAYLQETVMLLGVIPVVPYALPGSEELAIGAAGYCREYHGILLEHHGAVAWGGGVIPALYRLESIEYTATVTMYSKLMGFTRTMDEAQIAKLTQLRGSWGITAGLGNFHIRQAGDGTNNGHPHK